MTRPFRPGLQVEYAAALAVLAGGVYAMWHLITQDYLPQPFFHVAGDAWMDWFNTAFWAHNPGAYDAWQTLYPPVSFVFLKFVTLPRCYIENEGLTSRDCDWYGMLTMHGFFVLNIFLIGKTFLKADRETALPRSIALAAGMPMLSGLERGNLILVAFTCVLLGFGPLLRSARLRWLFVGLAINFKIYLIGTIFAYPIRRKWRWFEGAFFYTIAIYLVTWGIMGAGTPIEIYRNLSSWNDGLQQAGSLLDYWHATTYTPLIGLLNGSIIPVSTLVGSWRVETFATVLPLMMLATQLAIICGAAAAWLRPDVVSTFRVVNLAASLALITTEGGGYTQTLIIFLTFLEPSRGLAVRVAIMACYVLAIPGDIYVNPLPGQFNTGFINIRPVFYSYWMTYGPYFRPAFVLLIPFALACATLTAVWRDIREQGWRLRWRYRRDAPIMVGAGTALRPHGPTP